MNLSFLSPLFLIGLLAITLPLIAHLISRKTSRKKSFPAVRFLISTQGDLTSTSKIKDLFFLLLRALILVLIVLLFAKPAVFSFSQKIDNTPLSLAIVIDNSFSMGYADNFKNAKEKALETIDSLPDGSFALVTALVPLDDDEPTLTQDMGILRNLVKKTELSYSYINNEKRLQDIYSKLNNAPNDRKEILLITDFQKNGWLSENIAKPWLKFINISNATAEYNHAVSDTELTYINNSTRVQSKISNFSDEKIESLLTFTQLGKQEIKEFIEIEPSNSKTMVASFDKHNVPQPITGRVKTANDQLPVDDIRYFISNENEQSKILIADGDPREDSRLSETYYLARALETISENTATNTNILDNSSLLNKDLSDYDLIYLANIGDITPRFANGLEKFVMDGGTAVIFLGNRVSIGTYNALLKNILPGELQTIEERDLALAPKISQLIPQEITARNNRIKINKLFNISVHPESEVLIKAIDNTPFLIKGEQGKGKVFLFSSSADTAWNNFSITPIFLPVIKMIHDLPNLEKNKSRHYVVGETVQIGISEQDKNTVVVTPEGKKYAVNSESKGFTETWLSGIYTVEKDGQTLYEFAVNVDPSESNLEKISTPQLAKNPEHKGDIVKVFKEIWRYFLWGAIALFVSEAVFRGIFS